MDFWLPIWILLLLNFGLDPPNFACGEADKGTDTKSGTGTGEPEEWNVINGTVKRNYTLTGIPQIDYVHDPNLPRELNGYNLSTYPFFNKIPKNINFSCDGLKDGFYASVEHKCQLYHHCLFGTRYDFLCANYTAFDQRTFICQFVSEVDCPNSALFFHRNDALYKSASTTTVAPVVIYVGPSGRRIRPSPFPQRTKAVRTEEQPVATQAPKVTEEDSVKDVKDRDYEETDVDYPIRPKRRRNRRRCGPGRRRRCRRPRPRPEYYDYYDYDDYYDTDRPKKPKFRDRDREYDDYEDYDSGGSADDLEKVAPAKKGQRSKVKEDFESRLGASTRSPVSRAKAVQQTPPIKAVEPTPPISNVEGNQSGDAPLEPLSNRDKIFSKSRAPPKIRPPVPIHEKLKYGALQGRKQDAIVTTTTTTTTTRAPPTTTAPPTIPPTVPPQQDYDEYYEDEVEPPTTYRNNVILSYPPTPSSGTRSSTVTTPLTTPFTTQFRTQFTTPFTTQAPPPTEPQYEYEYEDYDDTTTTIKPEVVTATSTARNLLSSRRFQLQQRQESAHVEDRRRGPGVEHQKINEALEAPTLTSLRIPYHNKPRPSFVKNAHMLIPLTTEKETTSLATTTTTSERPMSPFESTFDGLNRRFPTFDTDTRLPLETVSAQAEKQRMRFRTEPKSTTQQPILDEYMAFEEVEPEQVTERYGQNYPQPHTPTYTPPPPRRSMTFTPSQSYQPPFQQEQQDHTQQQQHQQQRSRSMTFDLPRGDLSPSPDSHPHHTPEYISLVSEDEDNPSPYLTPPPSRGRSRSRFPQGMRMAPQEVYPSYVPAPPSFVNHFLDQYINSRAVQSVHRTRRHGGQRRRSSRSRPFYTVYKE